MKSAVRVLAVVVGLWAWSVPPAWGQDEDPPRLDAIWEAYERFDYATARRLGRAALDAYDAPEDLARVHLLLGLVAFSENNQEEAYREFEDALFLDRTVRLDSSQVSPKILDFFEEIRARLAQARPEGNAGPEVTARYVLVPDRRAEAALRSMVLPGWGQLYKGQRTKGRLVLGAWGVAVAGSITAHVLRQEAYDDYRAADNPDEALERYDPFNRWHKARNALLAGVAGVWIYGYVDALISGGRIQDRRTLLVGPALSRGRMHVSLRVHF